MITPNMNGKSRRRIHRRLTHLDAIRVAEWLQENSERVTKEQATLQQAAQMIEQALGIAATVQTVERIGQNVGIKFQVSRTSRLGSVLVVAKAVADLYGRLGEPVPDDLAELLGRTSHNVTNDGTTSKS